MSRSVVVLRRAAVAPLLVFLVMRIRGGEPVGASLGAPGGVVARGE